MKIFIKHSLHNHLNNSIQAFADNYQHLWQHKIKIDPRDAVSSFESTLIAIRQSPYKLYLLIDEYDNFANEVMMGRGLERVFITGVSPVLIKNHILMTYVVLKNLKFRQ